MVFSKGVARIVSRVFYVFESFLRFYILFGCKCSHSTMGLAALRPKKK